MESDRKRQILDTAERLFSERGYHATSIRDIAASLELKGGSLYSHINGKEELLWRSLERAADRFKAALDPFLRSDAPAVERLQGIIAAHMRVITENLPAATVYFHEWRFLTDPQRTQFLERRDQYEKGLRGLVSAAIAAVERSFSAVAETVAGARRRSAKGLLSPPVR